MKAYCVEVKDDGDCPDTPILPTAKTKKFKVGIWLEVCGHITLEAESAEQAEEMAYNWLDEYGGFPDGAEVGFYAEETNREYSAQDAIEVQP